MTWMTQYSYTVSAVIKLPEDCGLLSNRSRPKSSMLECLQLLSLTVIRETRCFVGISQGGIALLAAVRQTLLPYSPYFSQTHVVKESGVET